MCFIRSYMLKHSLIILVLVHFVKLNHVSYNEKRQLTTVKNVPSASEPNLNSSVTAVNYNNITATSPVTVFKSVTPTNAANSSKKPLANIFNSSTKAAKKTSSSKLPSIAISTSTKKSSNASTETVIPPTIETVLGNRWDGWKHLLTRDYWKKRINDKFYLFDLLLPMAVGFVLSLAFFTTFCLIRCIICRSKHRRKARNNRIDYLNKSELSDNTWMLLEHNSSDSEVEAN